MEGKEELRNVPVEFVGEYCISCGQPLKPKRREVRAFVAILLVVIVAFSSVLYMQHNLLQLRESEIRSLTEERDSLKLIVSSKEAQITTLKEQNALLEKAKALLEQDKAELEKELAGYKTGGYLKLSRPTRAQLESYLRSDKTDQNKWREGSESSIGYVCINFAADLKANAMRAGWNISFVSANYNYSKEEYGHAFNMAILEDGSIVYIDTYTDTLYGSVEALIAYATAPAGKSPDYITVVEIAVVW